MNDLAINYEYIIRKAFQCGRYGVAGANADVYRGLLRSELRFKNNLDKVKKDDLHFAYAFKCGEVSTYLITALEKFAKDYEERFTEIQNEEIEEIISLLNDAKIKEIDQAINRLENLMQAFGITPQ